MRRKSSQRSKLMAAALAIAVIGGSVLQPLNISEAQETEQTGEMSPQGTGPADNASLQGTESSGNGPSQESGSSGNGSLQGTESSGNGSSQKESSSDKVSLQGMETAGNSSSQGSGTSDEGLRADVGAGGSYGTVDEVGGSEADTVPGTDGTVTAVEYGSVTEAVQDYLTASDGDVEVTVYRQEGNGFPEGMTVKLIPAKERHSGSPDVFDKALMEVWAETLYDSYLKTHPETYTQNQADLIREHITESIRLFDTYYIELTAPSGSEPDYADMVFDFHIRDAKLYSQVENNEVSCAAGRYVPDGDTYVLAPDNGALTVVRHEDEKYLTCSLPAGGAGLFTLLTTDNSWKPAEAGESEAENGLNSGADRNDLNREADQNAPDSGADQNTPETKETEKEEEMKEATEDAPEDATEDATENATEKATEEASEETTEGGPEDAPEEETKEEAEKETDEVPEKVPEEETEERAEAYPEHTVLEGEEGLLDAGISLYASNELTPSGTRVTESGTGYTIVGEGDRAYSSAYFPVRTHANSVVTAWNSAGDSVKVGDVATGGAKWAEYLLPGSLSAAGKFGYRVTNVAYNTAAKCYVDLYLTVNNFNNYTYNSDGDKISDVYPYLGISIADGRYISFIFNPRLPMMEIKCDLVKSGTTTPVPGNYRLRMLDIDAWQRFAIGMQNGSVSGKYALSGSKVYVGSKTAFGHTYNVFNGNGILGDNDPMQSVVYELTNTSGFYLLFQIAYRNDWTTSPTNTIRRVYEEALSGSITSNAILNWDGGAYGATEISAPLKYVSNDGINLGTSNNLSSSTSSYYYTIDHFVPEESSGYYYSGYKIYDDLPAGVQYDGAWSAVQLESGANVTGWFGSNSSGKHMEFNAGAGALSSAAFYGYHYRFTFKVKMNPAEISPVYNGNSAVYTVKNTGHVTVTRSTGPSGTKSTNTVTTAVTETRVNPEKPVKGIDGKKELVRKKYGADFKSQNIVFSVFQKIPAEPVSWKISQITMTDVLQEVLQYDDCQVYVQKSGEGTFVQDTAWTLSAKGQSLVETRAYDPALAGATVRWDITCQVKADADLDTYHQVIDGVTWAAIPNTAKTRFDWTHGAPASVEQTTNTVTILFPVSEVNISIVKTNRDTGENIPDAVFTVYEWDGDGYEKVRGEMEYREAEHRYRMENLDRTNANQGKFKVVETTTPFGHVGSWEQEFAVSQEDNAEPLELSYDAANPMSRGTITVTKKSRRKGDLLEGGAYEIRANKDVVSPEGKVLVEAGAVVDNLSTGEDGSAVSRELYPGEYLVTETKAPLEYALDADPQVVAVVYKSKDIPVTNVEVTFVNDRLYGSIELTKEIDAEDIVWAHGNPTFTFKIEGVDVLGEEHVYYDTVEFTRENVDTASGKIALTAVFKVLAGTYTCSEEITMRYSLETIHSVRGGVEATDGKSVDFDLSEGGTAAAAFYNVRTTDEDESHCTLVRNHIVK